MVQRSLDNWKICLFSITGIPPPHHIPIPTPASAHPSPNKAIISREMLPCWLMDFPMWNFHIIDFDDIRLINVFLLI